MFEFKTRKPEESSSNWKPWHKDWDATTSNFQEDNVSNDDNKYRYNRKGFLEDDEARSNDSIFIVDPGSDDYCLQVLKLNRPVTLCPEARREEDFQEWHWYLLLLELQLHARDQASDASENESAASLRHISARTLMSPPQASNVSSQVLDNQSQWVNLKIQLRTRKLEVKFLKDKVLQKWAKAKEAW
nr:hypothetical protein [Tanacetum cinerariifolium]